MERDVFLSRIAAATMTGDIPTAAVPPPAIGDYEATDLQARFRSRAQSVETVVHGPVSRHGVPRAVAAIAAGHDATTFLCWEQLSGVPSALTADGLERFDHEVPVGSRNGFNEGYMPLDLGVTGADAGLAESGSVVLRHGPGRPRMASAIPEIHVAVLGVASIFPTLAHWAESNPTALADDSNTVIVTGPSRTGDIEPQINLGVHGPRHVHVVLVK